MAQSLEKRTPEFAIDQSRTGPAGPLSPGPGGAPPPGPLGAPRSPGGAIGPLPILAEEEPAPRDRTLLGRLAIAEWLLKHRDYLLDEIEAGRGLRVILWDLLLVATLPTAFYGFVIGLATNSLLRILTNPIKLPLVLVFAAVLCLPTLYIFSSYLGGRRTFLQTAALGFTGIAITGVVLAAFAPITWFLTFTAPGAYALHVLVSVGVLALGGFMGIGFLFHGTRRLHADSPNVNAQIAFLTAWVVLYGMVGLQMGWLLAPFFSDSPYLIHQRRPGEESVFGAILNLVSQLFR